MIKYGNYKTILAFSLIELSIVLIIIGLLVAGVTGGASLIQSAKTRALINELNEYKQAVYTFRVVKDRLPDDLIGNGKIGWNAGQNYQAGDFPAPYDGSNVLYGAPKTDATGPFVDLYLEKIIDFQPINTGSNINRYDSKLAEVGAAPYSKVIKDADLFFYSNLDGVINPTQSYSSQYKLQKSNWFQLKDNNSKIEPKIFKAIDDKLDDGIYNNGNFRGYCNDNSYEDSIDNKIKCCYLDYRIEI